MYLFWIYQKLGLLGVSIDGMNIFRDFAGYIIKCHALVDDGSMVGAMLPFQYKFFHISLASELTRLYKLIQSRLYSVVIST